MKVVNHLLEGVPYKPSPNISGFIKPRAAVMHYTAGWTAESAISTLINPAAKVSAQLVIDRDGDITQLVPFNRAAWHAGPSKYGDMNGMNNHSIGFEFVNPGWMQPVAGGFKQGAAFFPTKRLEGYDLSIVAPNKRVGGANYVWPKYTDAQISAGLEAFAAICKAYDIEAVVSHEEIDTRGWKTDPGPAFPMALFKGHLYGGVNDRSNGMAPMKTGWIVGSNKLNLRSKPDASGPLVAVLQPGQAVVVLEDLGVWSRVQLENGTTGYVSDQYLRRA